MQQLPGINLDINMKKSLFANYLSFLQAHRGSVSIGKELTTVVSDKEEFTFAIPEHGASIDNLQKFNTFYTGSWSGNAENYLDVSGYKSSGGLNYMVLYADHKNWKANESIQIIKVKSTDEMEDFSITQSLAFTTNLEEYNEWYPWLRAANFRNHLNPAQQFYVAYENGNPVGTSLAITTEKITGIYAVATLKEHQKKGVSTTLMKQAVDDALISGAVAITLQVADGSYAESFYKKLGFASAFKIKIYSRNS